MLIGGSMMLAMTSDYATSTGCPEPYLRRIAAAGFTHVHWCHQWNTDFLYADCEVTAIEAWLRTLGLQLVDLHASTGVEKNWASPRAYERQAGLELIRNRMAMAARLAADVIILHPPPMRADGIDAPVLESWQRSLDELEKDARQYGVRVALENSSADGFTLLAKAFAWHGPDYVGLCYDAGHGNNHGRGLDDLEAHKDRLLSLHLHDNDGPKDEHRLIFSGTVDWARLARLIAASPYDKCVSMETIMRNTGIEDEAEFLAQAFETGTRFANMAISGTQHPNSS